MLREAPVLFPFGNGGPHGAAPEPEAETGSEDLLATLAEAIGGLAPITPPPDEVLADELERVLATRPEPETGSTPVADTPPSVPAAAESMANPAVGTNLAGVPESGSRVVTAAASSPAKTTGQAAASDHARMLAVTAPLRARAAAALEEDAPSSNANAPVVPPVAPQNGSAVVATGPLPALRATVASRRELAECAWKLHELGNSLPSIQVALEALGGSSGDIDVVMAKLAALEQARQARIRRNLQWTVAGALVVLVTLLTLAVLISQNAGTGAPAGPRATTSSSVPPGTAIAAAVTPAPHQTPGQTAAAPTGTLVFNPVIDLLNNLLPGDVKIANGASPTAAATSAILGALFPASPALSPADLATASSKKSGLPSWVSTLVPNGITVINVPTPSVDSSGPPAGPCPATADQASALFGGPAASWTYNRQQAGWIFILADKPATIRIPSGMAAGYLVIGESLEMRSVLGPATVHDVNFVAVSCY